MSTAEPISDVEPVAAPEPPPSGSTPASTRPRTDLGNAERLIARYGDRLRFCRPRRRWLVWSGDRWTWDETGEVERFAKKTARAIYQEASRTSDPDEARALAKHAAASESAARLQATIALATSEPGIAILPVELDADPWLFNCRNGTLDLRTGVLRPHRREDLITKLAPLDFDPSATSETWERALRGLTGGDDDLAAYLQRVAGYCLTGVQSEKCFFFAHGPPNTGKSTFLDALRAAFGDYAASASATTWMQQTTTGGNRGDLVRLMGARLVTSSETRKGCKWDEEQMRRITGGDPIVAAAKYEADVEFVAPFKILLAANDAPTVRDDDEAMWTRMRRLPFVHVPSVRDPNVKAELTSPARSGAAILAWAVRGCLSWQRDGLGTCAAVDESTAAYRADMDRFEPFARDCLAFEPYDECFVTAADLRDAYERWCREQGVRVPLAAGELAKRLGDRGANASKGAQGRRVWRRVRLQRSHEEGAETRAN